MALKFRRGTTAQKSGSLAFGEPYVNTTLGTLQIGGPSGDITLSSTGTGSTGNFGAISGSGLDITGDANIAGNLTLGGQLTIGDQTSDTVNVVASLSSSLIPTTTNTFDLGTADKIWRDLYISTGSIKFVEGNTVVKTLNANTITALEAATGSANTSVSTLNSFTGSQLTQNSELATVTGSLISSASAAKNTNDAQDVSISNLNTFSGSQLTQNSELATITGSLISTSSANVQRLGAIEAVSGTFARTNSTNTFNGNQTVSGSLTVTQDLVVLGSSSILTISSSTLDIGTNLITVNVNQPSVRFGGLAVIDSGSSGASGSFLYDAVQDEFIFVHKGNGTNVTSSHFVLGPETYDNLGNEIYLTNNTLAKGTGKEHLNDSQIVDDGTTVSIPGNLVVTGSINAPQLTTLGTYTASVEGRFTTLASLTGSNGARLTSLETTSASVNISIANINVATASLQTTSASVNTSISNLNTTTASLLIETINLELFTASLSTTSNVRFGSLGIGMAASGTSGRIDAAGDIVAFSTSDRNFKENITPIPNAIDKIRKISGNTYDWKVELKDIHGFEGNDVGVIAQEIEEVLPQLVTTRETGYKAVKYDKIVALLIEGIKEQQLQIEQLRIDLDNCRNKGL